MFGHYNSFGEHLMNWFTDWKRKAYRRYVLGAINGGNYMLGCEYHVFVVYCHASIPVAVASYKPP